MRRQLAFLILLGVVLAASATSARADSLLGSVLASGGDPSSGPAHVLHGTAGQAATGLSDGPAKGLCSGFWCFGGARVLAVDDTVHTLPSRLEFGPPAPNPASDGVTFSVGLPARAGVQLIVYDVSGRRSATVVEGSFEAGRYAWRWDGRDGDGRHVNPGVFFARLAVDGQIVGRRVLVFMR